MLAYPDHGYTPHLSAIKINASLLCIFEILALSSACGAVLLYLGGICDQMRCVRGNGKCAAQKQKFQRSPVFQKTIVIFDACP